MGARRLRPGTTKVSGLTPENHRLLLEVVDARLIPGLSLTPTTATFPSGPATAHHELVAVIAQRKAAGQETRALHAVRRKLERQVRPGDKPQVRQPDPPKARRTKNAVACAAAGHGELVEVGTGRAKCLDCGLIVERPTPKPARQRPARPSQGGVTSAQVIPAASKRPAGQKRTQRPQVDSRPVPKAATAGVPKQRATRTVHRGDQDPTGQAIIDTLHGEAADRFQARLTKLWVQGQRAVLDARAAGRPDADVEVFLGLLREVHRMRGLA